MNQQEYIFVEALGRRWLWPEADRECRAVVFDWSADLGATFKALEDIERQNPEDGSGRYRSCIQAGGNMGVWPWLLAKAFHNVYTFEPDPTCFHALCANTMDQRERIHVFQAAVSNKRGRIALTPIPQNLGAQFVTPAEKVAFPTSNRIPTLKIDDLQIDDCDLIYLDIEGLELQALYGAYNTIKRSMPVIVVEDKGLSDKYGSKQGDIERWLWHEFKYDVVARPHRDVVLSPPKTQP